MFYGTDPYQADLLESLSAALQTVEQRTQAHTGVSPHIYALIDGAFDSRWGNSLLTAQARANPRIRSLYTGSTLQSLEECAPFLVAIDRAHLLTALGDLLEQANGRPMLSFIQSPLEVISLQKHLLRFCQIRTPDTLVFPLRLADSIGLPEIIGVMEQQQRSALLAGIAAWHSINRQGGAITIEGHCKDAGSYAMPAHGDDECIPFTDEQFSRLVQTDEPEQILATLARERANLLAATKASVLFSQVSEILREMDQRQLMQEPVRKILALHAVALSDWKAVRTMLDLAQSQGTDAALAFS